VVVAVVVVAGVVVVVDVVGFELEVGAGVVVVGIVPGTVFGGTAVMAQAATNTVRSHQPPRFIP
jgi:hypothetical protein